MFLNLILSFLVLTLVNTCKHKETQELLLLDYTVEKNQDCIVELARVGQYQKVLHTLYLEQNLMNYYPEIQKIVTGHKETIDDLIDNITLSQKSVVMQPALQWAQSKSNIFIQLKFAHRLDSPACLNTKIQNVVIKNNSLSLNATGVMGDQPYLFQISLNFFQEINVNLANYTIETAGTLFFNITKTNTTNLWPSLVKPKKKFPIWWDMKSTIGKDMDLFSKMMEEQEDLKEEKQKQREKLKKKKARQQGNRNDDI